MIAPNTPEPTRRYILLPGETHAPADPGALRTFELHGIREFDGNPPAVGLDLRRGPTRFVAAIASPVFLEAVDTWLKHHDCRIVSNRVSPVKNFRNALDSVGFDWKDRRNQSLDNVLQVMDRWWASRAAVQDGAPGDGDARAAD